MSPNQYCSLLQMHQITSLASHVSLWWTHIGQNLCICTCLRYILVSNACDVATNPGPLKFPTTSHGNAAAAACPTSLNHSLNLPYRNTLTPFRYSHLARQASPIVEVESQLQCHPRSQYSNIQPQTSTNSETHSNSYKLQITCQKESRAYQSPRLHQS